MKALLLLGLLALAGCDDTTTLRGVQVDNCIDRAKGEAEPTRSQILDVCKTLAQSH